MAAYNADGSHIVGGTAAGNANQFWNTMHGNNINIAVIEWCKLFGKEAVEKHHWKRVVKDKVRYKTQLLAVFRGNSVNWEAYWNDLLKYRDKFAAHLDEDNQYLVPYLPKAQELVEILYNYLLKHEAEDGLFRETPPDIKGYYQLHFDMARAVYLKQNS
jgi:hypothetical protein